MGITVKTQGPQPGTGMCAGCPGLCCTTPIADLTSYDIFRIEAAEGKRMEDFAELKVAGAGDAFAFRWGSKMVKLVLKKRYAACVFFDSRKTLGCTIEKSKPSVCLAYPFFLRGESIEIQERLLCPKDNIRRADNAKMSASALRECRWEFDRYAEIVGDWNLTAGHEDDLNDFFKFASRQMELETSPIGIIQRKLERFFMAPKSR